MASLSYAPHPDLSDPDLPDAQADLDPFPPGPSRLRGYPQDSSNGIGHVDPDREALERSRVERGLTAGEKEGWTVMTHSTGSDTGRTRSLDKGKGRDIVPPSGGALNAVSGPGSTPEEEDATTPLVGPLGAKALASITGAVTTSLLMTPFDVLKTRLQTTLPTSSAHPPTSSTPSSSFRPGEAFSHLPSPRAIPTSTSSSAALGETVCCQTAVLPGARSTNPLPDRRGEVTQGSRSAIGRALRAMRGGGNDVSGDGANLPGSGSKAGRMILQTTSGDAICLSSTVNPESVSSTSASRRFFPTFSSASTSSSFLPSFYAPNAPSGSGAATLTLPTSAPAGCLHPSKWHGIWGEVIAVSGPGSAAISLREAEGLLAGARRAGSNAASDIVEGGMRSGSSAGQSVGRGFFSEIQAILREGQGVRGLWKGVGTSLIMSIPSASLYMIGYEHLLTLLSPRLSSMPSTAPQLESSTSSLPSVQLAPPSSTSQPYFTPAPFIAGSLARTLSATVISPLELFRVRLQALPAAGQLPPTYRSTFDSIVVMVKDKDIRALWRGIGPTLWRDVPFSGAYWANFEILKKYLTESGTLEPGLKMTFIAGATSGTVASIITSPFDVLKTRRQAFTPSASCSPAAVSHPASTMPLLAHIVKTEGWKALFAGIVPRTAKIAPACGIMIGCYEGVGRYLGGKEGGRL